MRTDLVRTAYGHTTARSRAALAACVVVATFVWSGVTARADDPPHLRVAGTVHVSDRELPAQIRFLCDDPRQPEIQLAVMFASGAEAAASDALFPFGDFEGPDGKPAPIAIQITPKEGKPWKAGFTSAAGWFGVEDEYLFSLRPADGKAFLKHLPSASSLAITIAAKKSTLAFRFPIVGDALTRATAACH